MKGCFFIQESMIKSVLYYFYGSGRYENVRFMLEMCDEVITENNMEVNRNYLKECQVIFCTCNMILIGYAANEVLVFSDLVIEVFKVIWMVSR